MTGTSRVLLVKLRNKQAINWRDPTRSYARKRVREEEISGRIHDRGEQ
jgi:hypothetical protein